MPQNEAFKSNGIKLLALEQNQLRQAAQDSKGLQRAAKDFEAPQGLPILEPNVPCAQLLKLQNTAD